MAYIGKNKEPINVCFVLHADYSIKDYLLKTDIAYIYKVIFSSLYSIPELPFTIALSGSFIEWAQKEADSFLDVLADMLERKQIEILGGAFYEPFISIIPSTDLIGQIELMTDSVRKHFNKRVRGFYPPYSDWNASIIPILKRCGMEYSLLNKAFFNAAGLKPFSPVCLEENGKNIFAIPSTEKFKKGLPPPNQFYSLLSEQTESEETCLAVYLDPQTVLELFRKNYNGLSWFSEFLTLTCTENALVKTVHTGQLIKGKKIYQKGVIAPNAVLQDEPLNASVKKLVTEDSALYHLYAKMIYVHILVNQLKGDKARKKDARLKLWQAENAELFIRYDKCLKTEPLLRQYFYRQILLAEKQTRIKGIFSNSLVNYDFNMDGVKEFLSLRENLNMYVHNIGGKIFEFDLFSVYRNYTDINTDSGLFIDHLFSEENLDMLKNGKECPSVFANNYYHDIKLNRLKFELTMKTSGIFGADLQSVSLKKQYFFDDHGVQVQYILKNESKELLSAYFMTEMDIAVNGSDNNFPSVFVYVNDEKISLPIETGQFSSISLLQINGAEKKTEFIIEANENPDLLLIPVMNEEKQLLGIKTFFYWHINLQSEYEMEKMVFFKVNTKKQGVK